MAVLAQGGQMTWKDIGKKVAEAAPLLGNVLAGPVGGAAGSLIATIFGTEPDPDAVMKKIEQDPQAYLSSGARIKPCSGTRASRPAGRDRPAGRRAECQVTGDRGRTSYRRAGYQPLCAGMDRGPRVLRAHRRAHGLSPSGGIERGRVPALRRFGGRLHPGAGLFFRQLEVQRG